MRFTASAVVVATTLSLISSPVALAQPTMVTVTNVHSGKTVTIPERAAQVAPGVFDLGEVPDPTSPAMLHGYAIVHYREGSAKGNAVKVGGPTACYGFFASGAKWKAAEPWVMNTTNTRALDETTVFADMNSAIGRWETAAAFNIFGAGGVSTTTLAVDITAPDEQNEVYFGAITDQGAIAVTTVWGVFGGPTQNRKLVSWDMVFDQDDYAWSTSADAAAMNFANIATHELGHAAGLIDLYTSGCAQETMYGYADYGQTDKISLGTGDITGINKLY